MTNLDLDAIRRSAARGDPQLSATVLALCDQLMSMQRLAEHATARRVVDRIDLDELRDAARAYFAAVDRCDGIAAAEQALRAAVEQVTG